MDLGTLDLCLKVKQYQKSKDFYFGAGFSVAEEWFVIRAAWASSCRILEVAASAFIRAHASDARLAVDHRQGSRGQSVRMRDPDRRLLLFETES